MSYDPNQPWWGSPPGYQPPEGSNPGGYMPPPPGPGYPGAYPPPPGGVGAPPQYYGAYPGPMAPSTSNWAIASLMCSIAGWFLLPVLGSVLGVIFGHIALGEIRRSEGRLEGRGMAIAGLIIGYAMLAFAVCVIAVIIAVIANGVGNPSFPTQ